MKKNNYKNMLPQNHPFHMVTISPWPILNALNAFNLMISIIIWFYLNISIIMLINFTILLMSMFMWWRDIIRESTFQGNHTLTILSMMKLSMILFICSELLFFVSFFWTYFHNMLSPSIDIGMNWPPKNIFTFNPYEIPLLNSLILITSGMTLTWSHNYLLNNKLKKSKNLLLLTILLGIMFSLIQYLEYYEASFCINDSVFGSIFYMMTGFHGLHVMIGIIFLSICFMRMINNHLSSLHHFNFESSSWYWHFVDVIWLFLYLSIYWWNY